MGYVFIILCALFYVSSGRPLEKSSNLTKKDMEELESYAKNPCTISADQIGSDNNSETRIFVSWPSSKIPFVIASNTSEEFRSTVFMAMERIESVSCVRFVNKTNDPNDKFHITIKPMFCESEIGGISPIGYNEEIISPGYHIVYLSLTQAWADKVYSSALHELLHTLGFIHEHERWDRDEYLTLQSSAIAEVTSKAENELFALGFEVDLDNIPANYNRMSETILGKILPKQTKEQDPLSQFDLPYDYSSIMHYWGTEKDPAIWISKEEDVGPFYHPMELSESDIRKLNLLYDCQN